MRGLVLFVAAACVLLVTCAVPVNKTRVLRPGRDREGCSGKDVVYNFQHGDFKVTVLSDGYLEMAKNPFTAKNATVRKAYEDAQMEAWPFEFPQNVVVLRRGPHVILVDAGSERHNKTDALVHNLRKAGIPPESVTHILLTHGHSDHVGGLVDGEKAVYPNAKVYISIDEFHYWSVTAPSELRKKLNTAIRLAESNVERTLPYNEPLLVLALRVKACCELAVA